MSHSNLPTPANACEAHRVCILLSVGVERFCVGWEYVYGPVLPIAQAEHLGCLNINVPFFVLWDCRQVSQLLFITLCAIAFVIFARPFLRMWLLFPDSETSKPTNNNEENVFFIQSQRKMKLVGLSLSKE